MEHARGITKTKMIRKKVYMSWKKGTRARDE